jgi:integrase/recombinase XerD
MPAHHNAEAYLDAYIQAAGIAEAKREPLFRSAV